MSQIEPGIYFGLSNEAYHADQSISASGLNTLLNSNPLAYWQGSPFNPSRIVEETAALKYGQMFHEYVLEDTFDVENMVKKGCKTTTKQGMIGEGDFQKFVAIKERLKNDKHSSKLLGLEAPENVAIEVSCFWEEPVLGEDGEQIGTVPARCRWDVMTAQGIVADLKSIDKEDLSDRILSGHIIKYGYHRQASWYLQGLRAMRQMYRDGTLKIFGDYNDKWLKDAMQTEKEISVLVFASKKPPHVCRAVEVHADDLLVAQEETDKAKQIFFHNLNKHGSKEWPSGYEGEIQTLKLYNY